MHSGYHAQAASGVTGEACCCCIQVDWIVMLIHATTHNSITELIDPSPPQGILPVKNVTG